MFHRTLVRAEDVHDTLRRHVLVDGYPIVVDLDHSGGSWLRDELSGKLYLDFFSFFASNPIDLNHPGPVRRRDAGAAAPRREDQGLELRLLHGVPGRVRRHAREKRSAAPSYRTTSSSRAARSRSKTR